LDLLRIVTPRVRRVIARQRGFAGSDVVEDLVQDVLLSLHAVRATYDPRRPFMPWLLAILRNRLVDGARRHGRTVNHEMSVEDLDVTFQRTGTNSDVGDLRRRRSTAARHATAAQRCSSGTA
jgi:RNA polymerase sigma-70 factor (ECF subfamily)